MNIVDFNKYDSLISQYMSELRDENIQKDPMRFRRNLERIGEIMAFEISRTLRYRDEIVQTPLAEARCRVVDQKVVLATIFRAGLPFHQGFLSFFDRAENAFISAYRKYKEKGDFEVCTEYLAAPDINGKVVILSDPMLATGVSMEMCWRALLSHGTPSHVHIASVVASEQAVEYIKAVFPKETTTLWIGAIDPSLNSHSYIVPGLGDAGDLAFGGKL